MNDDADRNGPGSGGQEPDSAPASPAGGEDRINIMVVDDLPENLLVYRTILEELGENVVTASSGPEALGAVLRDEFAVILLDVNMPEMDGLETAELIRKRRKSSLTPIIFITAFADEVRTAQGYAYGAVDYIMSPIIPEILRAKVKVFVELFRMRQEVARHAEEQIALAEQRIALVEERSRRMSAEEMNRSLIFLAHSAVVLGRSLDFEATVRDIARLPVPFLADRACVVLQDLSDRAWRVIQAKASSSSEAEVSADVLGREAIPEPLQAVVTRVLLSGQVETANLEGSPTAVFPLQSLDETLGALVVARHRSPFTTAELSVLENLGSRCSVALENCALHLELQRADRHKSEFLAVLAHELRNPLAPVRNAIEILNLENVAAEHQATAREVIDRQVRQMTRLIDDLLDMSRMTLDQLELRKDSVELADVLESAIETSRPLIASQGHELVVSVPSEPIFVEADLTRLAQVFVNLLNNAAKYTDKQGRIMLEVARHQDEVSVAIRDTGLGIPAEHLRWIFEMFTQVDRSLEKSHGGLGIGLTLAKRLVEMHGGTISASSDGEGKGSEFVVRLPVGAGTTIPRQTNGYAPPRPTQSLKILVADDNHDAAETLALMLQTFGHETRVAFDGEQALDAVEAFRPDVAFLDIGMPRLNGVEACRRIRQRYPKDPIALIALTGWGQEEDRRKTRDAGFDHHVVKPVDPSWLVQMLMNLDTART